MLSNFCLLLAIIATLSTKVVCDIGYVTNTIYATQGCSGKPIGLVTAPALGQCLSAVSDDVTYFVKVTITSLSACNSITVNFFEDAACKTPNTDLPTQTIPFQTIMNFLPVVSSNYKTNSCDKGNAADILFGKITCSANKPDTTIGTPQMIANLFVGPSGTCTTAGSVATLTAYTGCTIVTGVSGVGSVQGVLSGNTMTATTYSDTACTKAASPTQYALPTTGICAPAAYGETVSYKAFYAASPATAPTSPTSTPPPAIPPTATPPTATPPTVASAGVAGYITNTIYADSKCSTSPIGVLTFQAIKQCVAVFSFEETFYMKVALTSITACNSLTVAFFEDSKCLKSSSLLPTQTLPFQTVLNYLGYSGYTSNGCNSGNAGELLYGKISCAANAPTTTVAFPQVTANLLLDTSVTSPSCPVSGLIGTATIFTGCTKVNDGSNSVQGVISSNLMTLTTYSGSTCKNDASPSDFSLSLSGVCSFYSGQNQVSYKAVYSSTATSPTASPPTGSPPTAPAPSVVSFKSTLGINGVTCSSLSSDTASQKAILLTIAQNIAATLQISSDAITVTYGTCTQTRRRLTDVSKSLAVTTASVVTQTTFSTTSPSTSVENAQSALTTAVTSGTLTISLQANSRALSAKTTLDATAASIQSEPASVSTYKPSAKPTSVGSIISKGGVLATLVMIIMTVGFF